ncbi:regulator of chromosome condensation family protein [Striga asiatica]|uniref:Regulator of chromosome condensation family protein n=1 Tax=Striga asiatica TaxID=4170 RepID=A0A5A7QCD0_STRAF|nr:regulator of chromosome condensation family protein [Striga asiatica]
MLKGLLPPILLLENFESRSFPFGQPYRPITQIFLPESLAARPQLLGYSILHPSEVPRHGLPSKPSFPIAPLSKHSTTPATIPALPSNSSSSSASFQIRNDRNNPDSHNPTPKPSADYYSSQNLPIHENHRNCSFPGNIHPARDCRIFPIFRLSVKKTRREKELGPPC